VRVGVTGGAGYIGSLLVKRLVEGGHEVVSVDNLMKGDYRHLRAHGPDGEAELLEGDIRDLPFLMEAFQNCDSIAHLASLPGLVNCREKPEDATSINVYGTYNVLEAARRLDIGKVVFCSSAAVYGTPRELPVMEDHPLRPLNLYGVTKLTGEKLMEVYHDNQDIETVTLRFGNVFGVGLYTNYDTVIPKFVRMGLESQDLTVYGDGTSSRDFVHVEDITQALTLALCSGGIGGIVFNVGGETMLIGRLALHVVETLKRQTGKTVGVVNLPPRPGETKEFSYDLNKIKEGLGYRPEWSVVQGIEQIINYELREGG
jgi:UDP-glucose 4-epimerase